MTYDQPSKPDTLNLTVGIVSWNTRDSLRGCLRSVQCDQRARGVEVCVVDNDSRDGSVEMVRAEFPQVRLITNRENVGFARAANQVWGLASGRYWLLLNPDAELRPGCLGALLSFMDAHPCAGLATARLLNGDGTPQYCAQPPPSILRTLLEMTRVHKLLPRSTRGWLLLGVYWTYDKPIEVGWTWGTALIARRAAVDQVGPLDETFFMYGEDVDWCLRMRRAGWEVWFCPEAEVVHHGGASARQRWTEDVRRQQVWNGYYRAVDLRKGRLYRRGLAAATLLGLAVEWGVATLRGRSRSGLADAIDYHLEAWGRR